MRKVELQPPFSEARWQGWMQGALQPGLQATKEVHAAI
jgi:monoamine oxidase